MKCVFSLWSAPILAGIHASHSGGSRSVAGFSNINDFINSWIISVNQYKKFFGNAHLVTDNFGKMLLSDILQLPFDTVTTELEDELNGMDSRLCFVGNLVTYTKQTEPFICPDFDCFIWEPLPDAIISGDIICQNLETGIIHDKFYTETIWLLSKFCKDPNNLFNMMEYDKSSYALNCGIFGGNNVSDIVEVASKSLSFLADNQEELKQVFKYDNMWDDNRPPISAGVAVMLEQYALAKGMHNKQIDISCLFSKDDITNPARLKSVARDIGFTHLISYTKRLPRVIRQLQGRVDAEYVEYHNRIIDSIQYYNTI